MPSTAPAHAESPGQSTTDGPLPVVFEAIAAAVVALGGVVFALVGSVLLFGIDRATIAAAVDAELSVVTLEQATLAPAQSVELASTALAWTGTGLLVTGVGLVGFAAGFLGLRYRRRRQPEARFGIGDDTAVAVVGSAAAAVLSFLPGAAGLGGVVAGYLGAGQARRPASLGAMTGALLAIPGVVVAVFALGGLSAGLLGLGLTDSAALVVVVTAVVVLFATAINVGLGALGGYVGGLVGGD